MRLSPRLQSRLLLLQASLRHLLRRRARPEQPRRILIAHRLLLGDTLLLAALCAALRQRWPAAELVMTCPPAFVPLWASRPYGVRALPYDPRQPASVAAVLAEAGAGFDLALLPGDNRHALLARACGARWIRAFAGDHPGWKNLLCDELLPWPTHAEALADLFMHLSGLPADQLAALRFVPADWPAPPRPATLTLPAQRYVVLHLGASNPLRYWPAEYWQALAEQLSTQGVQPVWTTGPGEQALLARVDPQGRHPAYAGTLDLAGLWHLLAGAQALVCPDTGVAHLAKLTGTPTVCLFGQGSDVLFGAGRFFADQPFISLIAEMSCRDEPLLFGRQLDWVRRCRRAPAACRQPVGEGARCMQVLTPPAVWTALQPLLTTE